MSFLSSILPVAGAVLGSFVAPGIGTAIGASLGGAIGGSMASGDAADAQQQGAQNAIDTQYRMYQQNQQNLAPWRMGGEQGLRTLLQQLGIGGSQQNPTFDPNASLVRPFGMQDIMQDPGYLFAQQQGQKAILNRASAGGGIWGGNTGKSLADYVTGLAGQQANNAFSRFNTQQGNVYNRLNAVSATGANTAGNMANLGAQVGQDVGSLQAAQGQYGAAGILGQQQAGQGASNNWLLGSLLNNTQQPPTQNNWLSSLFGNSGGGNGLNITNVGNPSGFDYSNVFNS